MKKNIPEELKGAGEFIEDFNTRIGVLEEKFGDNEKIAKTLSGVSENIKDFDKLFEKAFLNLLKTSTDIKSSIQNFVDESDRVAVNKLMKRFGMKLLWVISIIITAILTKKFG